MRNATKRLYSPKIPEQFIPTLYHLGRARRQPMTRLVAEAMRRYLEDEGVLALTEDESEPPSLRSTS